MTRLIFRFLPQIISYCVLIASSIALDYVLHLYKLAWIGRYLGIVGSVLIVFSFTYSMRKRKQISFGSPRVLLTAHEYLGWIGAVMILVHSGIHFNALLPWIAAISMMIVVASGHVGKFLLKRAHRDLREKRATLIAQGKGSEELTQKLFVESLTVDLMNRWRLIHIPFVILFVTMAGLHIVSILFFWNW
ncbi:MAG: hypothetical protein R3C41_11010 [Calditrichia bacterium]|nr:hypothetical protein [Calditrichia bacterium]